jgi:hypothetical protein
LPGEALADVKQALNRGSGGGAASIDDYLAATLDLAKQALGDDEGRAE